MSIYKPIIELLKEEDIVSELYRFQGARSFKCFESTKEKFLESQSSQYVYISKSLDHHKHFVVKRTRQLLNEILLGCSSIQINSSSICQEKEYKQIKGLIIRTEELPILSSMKFVCDKEYSKLLATNSVKNNKKTGMDLVERVDRRAYGGGYGVDKEWKDLLTYLTYFVITQKIEREDVLKLLSNMRQTCRVNRKDNATFIQNERHTTIRINPLLESNLTKYRIMEALESIVEKGIYLPDSELGLRPTKTIKHVITTYEKNKELVLKKLSKQGKM